MKELETARLKLRYLKKQDTLQIFQCWASDANVAKYVSWNPHESIAVTEKVVDMWLEEYKKDDCYRYGIELKEQGILIGMIDVVGYHNSNPVIGYCLGRKYWNHGYMTEALIAVTEELFSDGYETIVVEAADENIGSNNVIKKVGFELVTCRKDAISSLKPEIVTINSYRLSR